VLPERKESLVQQVLKETQEQLDQLEVQVAKAILALPEVQVPSDPRVLLAILGHKETLAQLGLQDQPD
jgi:hypothetical protein